MSADPLARRAQSALNATHCTQFLWPTGAVRAIIMKLLGRAGGAGDKGAECVPTKVSRPLCKTFALKIND